MTFLLVLHNVFQDYIWERSEVDGRKMIAMSSALLFEVGMRGWLDGGYVE
jgi:hypothetical protein